VLRLFLTRRWLVRLLAGIILATACVLLGLWQLDRNEQRAARNAVVEANAGADPVAIDQLVTPDDPVDDDLRWRPVTVRGTYDRENQLRLRLRPVGGDRGVHVVVPLVTPEGSVLLVDRGFVPGTDDVTIPPPPSGEVTITGRLRPSEHGRGLGGSLSDGTIRYLDIAAIAAQWDLPLYHGWVALLHEDPPAAESLTPLPEPTTEPGPHLSYAVQWFLFAIIGVGGFIVLIRAESNAPAGRSAEPTQLQRNDT